MWAAFCSFWGKNCHEAKARTSCKVLNRLVMGWDAAAADAHPVPEHLAPRSETLGSEQKAPRDFFWSAVLLLAKPWLPPAFQRWGWDALFPGLLQVFLATVWGL